MNLDAFQDSVVTRIATDTGSGGLYETGAELLQGATYWGRADADPTYPYAVLNWVANVPANNSFSGRGRDLSFDFKIVDSADSGTHTAVSVIAARALERLEVTDWQPTAPSGWTLGGPLVLENDVSLDDDRRVFERVLTFGVFASRSL